MSTRYSRSPPRIINSKPQFIGQSLLSENDKTYIQSMLQKLYKPLSSDDDRENYQKELSHELCKHFKLSVGVTVIQADENYLSRVDLSAKKPPTGILTFNKLLVRIWVKPDDIVPNQKYEKRSQ